MAERDHSLPGERNPQSAAKEFAPSPQGENVLEASMMAELIVTKKEIAPQLKESAGTSRPSRKTPARAVNDCGWREDAHKAEHSILWFLDSGGALGGGGRCLSSDAG